MTVHLDTLDELQSRQELVEVYRDHISSESLTGVVTRYTDDFVYLSLISEEGLPNGIAVVFAIDITRIRWGGNVRGSIRQLMQIKGSKPIAPAIRLESLKTVLESVNEIFGYVNVLTERMNEDITFIGELEQIDEQALVIHGFGTMSTRDRNHMLLAMGQVTRVDAEAAYEKDIKLLAMQGAVS